MLFKARLVLVHKTVSLPSRDLSTSGLCGGPVNHGRFRQIHLQSVRMFDDVSLQIDDLFTFHFAVRTRS